MGNEQQAFAEPDEGRAIHDRTLPHARIEATPRMDMKCYGSFCLDCSIFFGKCQQSGWNPTCNTLIQIRYSTEVSTTLCIQTLEPISLFDHYQLSFAPEG